MKILLITVLAATGFTFIKCHPADSSTYREKRGSSSASASASASSSGGVSSSNSFSTASANNNFGIGGLDLTAGLSIPRAETRTNPLFPWGAFAGINLPGAGRNGGCTGFGCGFQFGDFSAPFPAFGNNGGFQYNDPGLYARSGYFPNQFNNYPNSYNYNYPQYPNMGFYGGFNTNYPMFRDFQFAPNPNYQQQAPFPSANNNNNIADFARIGAGAPVYVGSGASSGPGARVGSGSSFSSSGGGNGGTFSSFSSSNNNGIYSGSATRVDPDGRVTTYQSGSGAPDSIQTRILSPGSNKQIYSASGVSVAPDGKVSAFRAGGQV